MAVNLIRKLLTEAVQTGGTYAEFIVAEDKVTFICDGGSRKSTRNYRQSKADIKEDEKVLKTISEKNLLFSAQLKRISFTLRNGRTASFEKSVDDGFCILSARKANEMKAKSFEYICFSSESDESTGIAFATEQSKNGKRQIKPCTGMIMNGPNASEVSNDLQLVISGDFRETEVSSIAGTDYKNEAIIEELCAVLESALRNMMHLGLLDMPLFSVLPNSMDCNNTINTSFLKTARNVCNTYPMFKNRSGSFVGRGRIVNGSEEVIRLFPQEVAKPFLGDRYWIKPCRAGSREERFLMDMGVPYFNRERFLQLMFSEDYLDSTGRILSEQSDKWLREFYIFCSEPITEKTTKRQVISCLKSIPSIRDSKGRMRYPNEITLVNGIKALSGKSVIIKPEIISPSGDDEYTDQLKSFFLNDLGIKEYSQKPEIEDLAASMMNKKQAVDKAYVNKLLLLAKYDEEHPGEIDFQLYAIFPFQSTKGIRRVAATELVIGKPYVREGNLLASATGRNSLWGGFKKLLSEEELAAVLSFVERSGAIGLPKIVKQSAEKHQDFYNSLYAPGRQGPRDSNYDYIIPGLDEILKKRSLQLNRLVWAALLQDSLTDGVISAEYSVNNRLIVNRCDSSLVEILRKRTWVPGKDGKFYMPENIAVADISGEFVFSKDNPILKALQFGSGIEKRKKALKEMERFATREGLRIVSEQEYQEFLKWKKERTRRN